MSARVPTEPGLLRLAPCSGTKALEVNCPRCLAWPREYCITTGDLQFHQERVNEAQRVTREKNLAVRKPLGK